MHWYIPIVRSKMLLDVKKTSETGIGSGIENDSSCLGERGCGRVVPLSHGCRLSHPAQKRLHSSTHKIVTSVTDCAYLVRSKLAVI